VQAEVKLEVEAKFCQPRPPIAPPPLALCPPINFPQQCDIFPINNCECQATLNDICTAAPTGDCLMVVGTAAPGTNQTGPIQIMATICNNCVPQNSSILFRFTDTLTTPTDDSFTFRATTFDNVQCFSPTAPTTVIVTGRGEVTPTPGGVPGTPFEVAYSLTITEGPGATNDSYALQLNGSGFFATASNNAVPDANVILQDCITLSQT
jgi:hypothetical protein